MFHLQNKEKFCTQSKSVVMVLMWVIVFAIIIVLFNSTRASMRVNIERFNVQEPIVLYGYDKLQRYLNTLCFKPQNKIPMCIFRTYATPYEDLHITAQNNLRKSLSTSGRYYVLYFSDEDCRSFIKDHCPQYLADFDVLIPGAFKADIWRLIVLYHYGGIYNDIGHKYLVPVNEIINHEYDEIILVKDREWHLGFPCGIHNAFLAFQPRHPMVESMLDRVISNIRNRRYGLNCFDVTGPIAIARAYNTYLNKPEDTKIQLGQFIQNGHRIKMLEFTEENNIAMSGVNVLHKRFDSYSEVFPDPTQHYPVLYEKQKVFRDKNDSPNDD